METYLNVLSNSPNVDVATLNKALDEYKDLLMIGNKEEKEKGKAVIQKDYKVFKKMFKPGQTLKGKIGQSITEEFKNVDIRNLQKIIGKE